MKLQHFKNAIEQADPLKRYGKVMRVVGLLIESQGPDANIGEVCLVHTAKMGQNTVMAEVVGFNNEKIMLMPYAEVKEMGPGCMVEATGQALSIKVGRGLIGKVLDSLGRNLDEQDLPKGLSSYLTDQAPPNPLTRPPIDSPVQVGVKAIDSLLTVGRGQRIGIFAGSGIGKSTLLGMIARNTGADINVIALIGERGREVREFIEKDLGEAGRQKSIVVVATSDQPALMRIKGAYTATAISKYFRDQGFHVNLMMDSVTRVAMAQREVGPTMPEAMQQIRKELGSDAVILNSKEIQTGGVLGLFKKRKIEVVAGLDPDPLERKGTTMPSNTEKLQAKPAKDQTDRVVGELQHLKKLIEAQTAVSGIPFPPDYQLAYQHLLRQEVMEPLAHSLIDELVTQHNDLEQKPSQAQIKYGLDKLIWKKLESHSFRKISYKKKVIQFAGPTGVGKTTTIAKIAAGCVLKDHKKVAFITRDTYRIAAVEQLKTYARILDVPVAVTYNQKNYQTAITEYDDYDLILVDTAGRNFRDNTHVNELQQTIREDAETYLVLSMAAKADDIMKIYRQFRHIPLTSLIMTKLDETRHYGSMLNLLAEQDIGIAYLTNGQEVPDDLFTPTPAMISNYITEGLFHEGPGGEPS